MERIFELPEIVIRPQADDATAFGVCFLDSSSDRKRQCGKCTCVNMSVRLLSTTNGKFGGLLGPAEPQQRECSRPMYGEQHRIKRTEMSCHVSRVQRARRVAGLAMDECEAIVSQRIARDFKRIDWLSSLIAPSCSRRSHSARPIAQWAAGSLGSASSACPAVSSAKATSRSRSRVCCRNAL